MVARRYTRLEFEDAMQIGNIGLLAAISKYDPTQSAFSTYAILWIRQAISRASLAHSYDGIRRPDHVGLQIAEVRHAERKLAKHPFDHPSDEEVTNEIDSANPERVRRSGTSWLPVADLRRLAYGFHAVSDETPRVGTVAESASVPTVSDDDEHDDIDGREDVRKLLSVLTSAERDVVEARFGLGDWSEPVPAGDVGRLLRIPNKRAWNLWVSAKAKLAEVAVA